MTSCKFHLNNRAKKYFPTAWCAALATCLFAASIAVGLGGCDSSASENALNLDSSAKVDATTSDVATGNDASGDVIAADRIETDGGVSDTAMDPATDPVVTDDATQNADADTTDTSTTDDAGSPGKWLSGASGNGAADGTLGTWRGRANEIAGTWCDNSVDDQVNLWSTAPGFELDGFAASIDIAVGAIYKADGETWQAAANGTYDERWKKSLETLKSRRQNLGTTYIRFAHEFNGDWWPHRWMVSGNEVNDFIKAWHRYRALQKSIFPDARLVWCPNDSTSGANNLDVRDAWPGDGQVDVVCIDSYNWWPHVNSKEAFDAKTLQVGPNGEPLGLETWRLFAKDKGLPLAIGEWGSPATNDDGGGGGDAPGFMAAFYAWLQQHGGTGPGQVLYEVLFNQWEKFELWPNTKQPNAAEEYRKLW